MISALELARICYDACSSYASVRADTVTSTWEVASKAERYEALSLVDDILDDVGDDTPTVRRRLFSAIIRTLRDST